MPRAALVSVLAAAVLSVAASPAAAGNSGPRVAVDVSRGPAARSTLFEVTTLGRLFIRNLAMPFDAYLRRQTPGARPVFSKTL